MRVKAIISTYIDTADMDKELLAQFDPNNLEAELTQYAIDCMVDDVHSWVKSNEVAEAIEIEVIESYPENKMKAEIIKINECQVCGYDETECNIVNNLCSVHTCEICGEEGFASPPKGDILCEKHGGQ